MIQTWNAHRHAEPHAELDRCRPATPASKGTDLDILRAPTLAARAALSIPGVQAVHLGIVGRPLDAERRQRAGRSAASPAACSGGVSHTLAQADGQRVLARRGRRRSSRRTTRTWTPSGRCRASIGGTSSRATSDVELPWGPNRRWLKNGGRARGLLRRMGRAQLDADAAIGHAADGARARRRERPASRRQRLAARRLQRRADLS